MNMSFVHILVAFITHSFSLILVNRNESIFSQTKLTTFVSSVWLMPEMIMRRAVCALTQVTCTGIEALRELGGTYAEQTLQRSAWTKSGRP